MTRMGFVERRLETAGKCLRDGGVLAGSDRLEVRDTGGSKLRYRLDVMDMHSHVATHIVHMTGRADSYYACEPTSTRTTRAELPPDAVVVVDERGRNWFSPSSAATAGEVGP